MEKMRSKAHSMNSSMLYRVVAVLLVAAVGTSMLATAPLAKYVTKTSVSDSARVAKFNVVALETDGASSNDYTLNLTNKTATLEFGVQNSDVDGEGNAAVTEVPTSYDIILTLPDEMPGVNVKITRDERVTEEGSQSVGVEVPGTTTDNKTYTFSEVATLPAGEAAADELTLTFMLDDPVAATSATYSGIKLEARISQVS